MPKIPSLHPTVRGWLLDGPLAEHIPAYIDRLRDGLHTSNFAPRNPRPATCASSPPPSPPHP
jgi:hypothetical protein